MEINTTKIEIPVTKNKLVDDIELIRGDITALREENKRLRKSLSEARSRVILLEENYIMLLEDLTQSNKIDLFIYTIFAICIATLGFYVYGLTH